MGTLYHKELETIWHLDKTPTDTKQCCQLKTKALKPGKEAVTDNPKTGSLKLYIERPGAKELASMSRIDEEETRPRLNCMMSSCKGGINKTKQRNGGNWWTDVKGEKITYNGIVNDHYRNRKFLLPNFGKYVEKEDKPPFFFSEKTSDVVNLPKLENKVLQKETKRRATPFAKSEKYEIKKWLDGVMFHIEEEQSKLNMDDNPIYERTRASGFSSKVLTRRRSMLNLGEIAGESSNCLTETNRELPKLRSNSINNPKMRPRLHKIHSDSSIKDLQPLTYDL